MQSILTKYADLLVHYCVEIQKGDKLYVSSTTLAEPLIKEVYRSAIKAGAHVEVDLGFREKGRIFFKKQDKDNLEYFHKSIKKPMKEFNASK